jgi:4-hydroxybenzoate polyprenyltransferase
MRLKFQLVFTVYFLLGFILAGGDEALTFLYGWFVWIILLGGGTVAFNSYYDRDKGPISFLEKSPKVTEKLLIFSLFLKFSGLVLAFFINFFFIIIYFVYFLLSIMYSHPRIRIKSKPGFDLIVNALGYGSLTFAAGWFTASTLITQKLILLQLIAFLCIATGYPLTQIFHYEEDKRRGDMTFVSVAGPRTALIFSMAFMFMAFMLFIIAYIIGYFTEFTIIVALPVAYTLYRLRRWYMNFYSLDQERELYVMYSLGVVTGLTVAAPEMLMML